MICDGCLDPLKSLLVAILFFVSYKKTIYCLQYCHVIFSCKTTFSADDTPQTQPYQNQLTVPHMLANADSSPESTPGQSPLPRSSSSANLQSASKLILSSTLVYSHRLELPLGVEVIRATPSAGTL